MTTATEPHQSPGYAISRAVGQIEAFCGVVVAGLLTLFISGGSIYLVLAPMIDSSSNRLKVDHYWLVVAGSVLALIAEVASFTLLARTLQQEKGRKLLALAQRHPTLPMLLRPIVFVWWAAHFALIALIGHYVTPMIRIVENPTEYQSGVTNLIRFFFAAGASFSTNSYLMLMTASLTRRRGVLQWVFRVRILADLLLIADLMLPHRWF